MDLEIKVAIVGPKGSGKTRLAYRFAYGTYEENVVSDTDHNIWQKNVTQNGKQVNVQVWDTAGRDVKSSINCSVDSIRNKQAIVIAFDVTERGSFDKVRSWLTFVRGKADSQACIVIAGTKCGSGNRVVTLEELKKFSSDNNVDVYETSALINFGIDELFARILHKALLQNLRAIRQEQKQLQQPIQQLQQQSSDKEELSSFSSLSLSASSSTSEESPVRPRGGLNVWEIIYRIFLYFISCGVYKVPRRRRRRRRQ